MAILGGETTIALHLEFLIRNNHADLLILKNTKVLALCIHKFFRGLCPCTCAFGWWRKTIISPLNFSLRTVYVLVIWCWYNSPIKVIKGTLYICTLHLSVSILFVLFSYLFVWKLIPDNFVHQSQPELEFHRSYFLYFFRTGCF